MRSRLGRVLWWIGALFWMAVAGGGIIAAFYDSPKTLFMVPIGAMFALPFWAACYVVAGTFWKAPSRE